MQQTYNEDPPHRRTRPNAGLPQSLCPHTVDKEVLNDLVLSGVGVVQKPRAATETTRTTRATSTAMLHMEKDLGKANPDA